MFCMNCGTALPETAKFCVNCGSKISSNTTLTNTDISYGYDLYCKDIECIIENLTLSTTEGFFKLSIQSQQLQNTEERMLAYETLKLYCDVDILALKNDLDFSNYITLASFYIHIINSDLNDKNPYINECNQYIIEDGHIRTLATTLYQIYTQGMSSVYSNFISELTYFQSRKDNILKLFEPDRLGAVGFAAKALGAGGLCFLNPLLGIPAAIGLFCKEKSDNDKNELFISEIRKHFSETEQIATDLAKKYEHSIDEIISMLKDSMHKILIQKYEFYKSRSSSKEEIFDIYSNALDLVLKITSEKQLIHIMTLGREDTSPYLRSKLELILRK